MIKLLTRFLSLRYKAIIRKQQQAITDIAYQLGRVQKEKAEALEDSAKYYKYWTELRDNETSGYVHRWDYDKVTAENKRLTELIKTQTVDMEKNATIITELKTKCEILERVNKDMDIRLKAKLCRVGK